MQVNSNTRPGGVMTTATSNHSSPQTNQTIILPGDRVLVYDTDRFRWHRVSEVLLGVRTKIMIHGANFYFDASLVAKHERRSR